MEITREFPTASIEESDQCTVTAMVRDGLQDVSPEEADDLGIEMIRLAHQAGEHERELLLDRAEQHHREAQGADIVDVDPLDGTTDEDRARIEERRTLVAERWAQ